MQRGLRPGVKINSSSHEVCLIIIHGIHVSTMALTKNTKSTIKSNKNQKR